MNPIPLSVTAGIAVALLVSLAGNAFLTHQYLGTRDELTAEKVRRELVVADAKACSDGVQALKDAADVRERAANASRDRAQATATLAQKNAQTLLALKPTVPANDCASAQAQVDDWLTTRVKP